jgi:hypothetical protein
MPPVGFELTISVLERAKTVHALCRAATLICDRIYGGIACALIEVLYWNFLAGIGEFEIVQWLNRFRDRVSN